ncbi:hypothetical protein [Rickettsia japonica]|nr:hypothetical protein [Rickettsia japonica]AXU07190.1 hypothetical protein D0Z68_05970 [Rickettsia japonica]QHE24438.1 hypothetical protein GRX81_00680 [Rickettsia japonica]
MNTVKLLSDPKVLGVVAETIVNLGKSKFSKDKEAVGPHTSKVLEERRREIGKSGRGALVLCTFNRIIIIMALFSWKL